MRIYNMTATFGKLEHESISFQPGLNVIHAPNEWGKSTWCAFLAAMLYGIDTRERKKNGSLPDKERFAPWSGSPMSGRMDLCWNGRDITIERTTRGRLIFGQFKAYETDTGLPVQELTADNCGQLLLGVEKSVFLRAGFIKLTDLPVSDDEALRRRLNALVTTGDESDASDALAKNLKDLKNSCRHNKTGRLPQLEAQRATLREKLDRLQQLQQEHAQVEAQQAAEAEKIVLLKNHQATLSYDAALTTFRRAEAARTALEEAEQAYSARQAQCAGLPSKADAEGHIFQLEDLRIQQDALQAEPLPHAPEKPETPTSFVGMTPEQALSQAKNDKSAYDMLSGPLSPLWVILGVAGILLAVALLLVDWRFSPVPLVMSALFFCVHIRGKHRQKQDKDNICAKYQGLDPEQWISTAQTWQQTVAAYDRQKVDYTAQANELNTRKEALAEQVAYFTGGAPLWECLDGWRKTLHLHSKLTDAESRLYQARLHADAFADVQRPVPPSQDDSLTWSAAETEQLLSEAEEKHRKLHLLKGQLIGQMEVLGQASAIEKDLKALQEKIDRLEDIYAAATIGLETLEKASSELQRRFAPRISQRAQVLFEKLTGGRYDRLLLGQDLKIHTGAQDEDTLRESTWRSDGTADQQYLALRLAVAEELTPHAPLVLDDAFVRFDDTRLTLAMEILKETARDKQVFVFSCQERERNIFLSQA